MWRTLQSGDVHIIYMVGGRHAAGKVFVFIECMNRKRRWWLSIHDMPHHFRFWWRRCVEQDLVLHTGVWYNSGPAWRVQNRCCYFTERLNERLFMWWDTTTAHVWNMTRPRTVRQGSVSHSKSYGQAVVLHGWILVAEQGVTKPESSIIEQCNPLIDTWSDWSAILDVEKTWYSIFNIDLHGVWQCNPFTRLGICIYVIIKVSANVSNNKTIVEFKKHVYCINRCDDKCSWGKNQYSRDV